MGMFKCTYFPKPYVVPAYTFKPLSTFKTLSPWPNWLKCSSVFSVLPSYHVPSQSSPCCIQGVFPMLLSPQRSFLATE